MFVISFLLTYFLLIFFFNYIALYLKSRNNTTQRQHIIFSSVIKWNIINLCVCLFLQLPPTVCVYVCVCFSFSLLQNFPFDPIFICVLILNAFFPLWICLAYTNFKMRFLSVIIKCFSCFLSLLKVLYLYKYDFIFIFIKLLALTA